MGSYERKDESSSSGSNDGGSGALQNPKMIHAKMDVSPYKVFDSVSTTHPTMTSMTTAIAARSGRTLRPPRNPQGKMRWRDGDSDDNEDGEADAEEIIDVDALIAEQVPPSLLSTLLFCFSRQAWFTAPLLSSLTFHPTFNLWIKNTNHCRYYSCTTFFFLVMPRYLGLRTPAIFPHLNSPLAGMWFH
jgi:hypothetical protein